MAEAIFRRVHRVVTAGVDSAVGAAERFNGGGLMRRAIGEIDGAIDGLRKQREAAASRALQADWSGAAVRDRRTACERDARFALEQGRDDLAKAAITRQLSLEAEIERLDAIRTQAEGEIAGLDEQIAELRDRKAQMEAEYEAAEAARQMEERIGRGPGVDRKIEHAEAAFERARAARGGVAVDPLHERPDMASAELSRLRAEAEIEARLAALRPGAPAPAPAPRKRKA